MDAKVLLFSLLLTLAALTSAKKTPKTTTAAPEEEILLPEHCSWAKSPKKGIIECDTDIPDFSAYNPAQLSFVNGLVVTNCDIVVLSYGNLQNLSNLTHVAIDCAETVVQDGAFNGLASILWLSISRSVGVLAKDLVCPLNQLKTLSLDNNYIGSDADFGLQTNCSGLLEPSTCGSNITFLSASNNMLSSINVDGFLCNLSNLTELNLTANTISTIEKGALAAAPSLRRLHLGRNSLSNLPVETFEAVVNLTYLDLSFNRLTTIPNGLFKSLTKLHFLNLRGNALSTLNPAIFTGITLLSELDLSNNQLTDVTWVFQPLAQLSKINLSGNRLQQINSASFPGLTSLNHVSLSNNNISTIADDAFAGSPRLSILFLGHNNLRKVPNLSYNRFLLALFLNHNDIEEIGALDFQFSNLLLTLELNDNKLTTLGPNVFASFIHLLKLNLSHNYLKSLDNSTFNGLFALKTLSIDGNELSFDDNIYEDATGEPQMDIFKPATSLLFLNLSDNEISQFQYSWFPVSLIYLNLGYNEIRELPTYTPPAVPVLHTLDLSNNLLENITENQFPPNVNHLVLNVNKIKNIEPTAFINLVKLESLNLRENALQTLAELKMGNPNAALFLRDNPWICDCKLSWLKFWKPLPIYDALLMKCEFLFNYTEPVDAEEEDVDAPTFAGSTDKDLLCEFKKGVIPPGIAEFKKNFMPPGVYDLKKNFIPSIYGQTLMKVGSTVSVTKCFGPHCAQQKKCPDNCYCYHNLYWTFVKVVCHNAGLTEAPAETPDATDTVYIDGNPIVSINITTFKSYKDLKHLYIRNTKLVRVGQKTFTFTKDIETIHLDHNELQELPEGVFSGLTKVKKIDISFNQLRSLPPDAFNGLAALQTLNLQNNMLTEFPVWKLPPTSSVGMSANPWTCNCSFMFPLNDYLKANAAKIQNITDIYCKPPPVEGQLPGPPANSTIPLAIFDMTQCYQTRFMAEMKLDDDDEPSSGSIAAVTVIAVMVATIALIAGLLAFVFRRELKYLVERRYEQPLL